MNEPNLFSICALAFSAVMLLLGLEAIVIRLISQFFPERKPENKLITEAIQSAIESRFPGARVVTVKEVKPGIQDTHAER
jgi:hypothetical protein